MSVAGKTSRFTQVRELLEKAAGGDAAAFGGVALWNLPYDQLIAAKLMGLPLIEAKKAAHSCCKSGASNADASGSALLLGLRGQQPFDGSQFPRLPWGRAAMAESEIAEIEEWIADGAPESDPETVVYTFAKDDWKTDTAKMEVAVESYGDVTEAYAEYAGTANEYKYQHGELRQRMNIDCMTPLQLEKLRYAFREIGIARLGDSPDEFCISPETPAALPVACDKDGNPLMSADGLTMETVKSFKDKEGRIKRQAARFQIFVYDEASPEGRPLEIGAPIEGGGNNGTLIDIQWRVYLANKKSAWYEFNQLEGEHGYLAGHPLRNADIIDEDARQCLIIDPGPQVVDKAHRTATFDRGANGLYAATFPPEGLQPHDINTLGKLLTDDLGRLLVLGGHGFSGSMLTGFSQPRIDHYANNDGWFDDTSDGPVMARLVMYSEEVGRTRYIDVEYPAWVIAGYPAYVPEILDIITADDVIYNTSITEFATRTDIYGKAGTFAQPQVIDHNDLDALEGLEPDVESGIQALVLSGHLADPLPCGRVHIPDECAATVELPA
jgi:hypothetical protein